MADWIMTSGQRQELERLFDRIGDILANVRQAETTPMPPPPSLGQALAGIRPPHPRCDGSCAAGPVNCPNPDWAPVRDQEGIPYPNDIQQLCRQFFAAGISAAPRTAPECEETDYDRYGDCDGPVTEFEQVGTLYGQGGLLVNLCASHARQAGMRGAVRWIVNG